MGNKIRISEGLELNADDLLESAIGIIGKRGRGKTGLIKVEMEEFVKTGLPFVAFDPVGVMWGIRSSLDGSGPGLPVLIVGGSHGDIRLDRRAGAEVAKAIVQANVSCIIDFSEESKGVYREFVRDFAHKLFAINDTPRHVIIEEAPELVPQKLRPDMTDVFEAVERLVSRGRNKAIGVTLVSQRAATINKDVLTQIDALVIFGLTSPQDRKALREWVEAWDVAGKLGQFEQGIAALARQEAWFWAPEAFGGVFKKVKVRSFTTFHPDKTHLRRTGLLEKKPITTDVTKIIDKLGAQLERLSKEKADTAALPKLQSRVRELERQLEQARTKQPAPSSKDIRQVVEQAKAPLLEEIGALKRQLLGAKSLAGLVRRIKKMLDDEVSADGAFAHKHISAYVPKCTSPYPLNRSHPVARTVSPKSVPRQKEEARQDYTPEIEEKLPTAGALRMLRVLASKSPLTLTRSQLGTLARITPSSGTYSNYFSHLRRLGYIEEDSKGNVRATEAGLDFAGEVPPAPSTHEEIVDMWKRILVAGASRMLDVVVEVYPEAITKEDLGVRARLTASAGTFSNYLSMLRRNGLVEVHGNDVVATEVLFP